MLFLLKVIQNSLKKNHEQNLPKTIVSIWDTIDKHNHKNKINTKSISIKIVASRKCRPDHTQLKYHKIIVRKEIK